MRNYKCIVYFDVVRKQQNMWIMQTITSHSAQSDIKPSSSLNTVWTIVWNPVEFHRWRWPLIPNVYLGKGGRQGHGRSPPIFSLRVQRTFRRVKRIVHVYIFILFNDSVRSTRHVDNGARTIPNDADLYNRKRVYVCMYELNRPGDHLIWGSSNPNSVSRRDTKSVQTQDNNDFCEKIIDFINLCVGICNANKDSVIKREILFFLL